MRVKRRRAGSPSRGSPSKGPSSSGAGEAWDSYCLATAGTVSLRTRCVAAATQPRWDEELVFSHVLEDGPHRPRVRFDIFQHGALADSRLMYTDLDLATMAPPPSQAQQKQAAAKPGGLAGPTTAYTLYLPLQADPGLLQSAAAVGAAAGDAAAAAAGGGGDFGGGGRRRSSMLAGKAAARAGSMRGLPGSTLVGQELEVVVWWSKQQIMTNAGGGLIAAGTVGL